MPLVADYGIISDDLIKLGSTLNDDLQELKFALDNPDPGSRAILAFNLSPDGAANFKLEVQVNDKIVKTLTYNGGAHMTVHEVIPAKLLKPTDNEIQFKALAANSGSIKIGDIVVWYQHAVGSVLSRA
jgi:hypothetical protein